MGLFDLDSLAYENAKADNVDKIMFHETSNGIKNLTDDPDDSGGRTNFGVSTVFLGELHKVGRWTQYKIVDDIPSEAAALKIFEKEFFVNNEVNYGKNRVALKMNDLAIHVGGGNATRIMQESLNDMYEDYFNVDPYQIAEDGGMGKNTRKLYKLIMDLGLPDDALIQYISKNQALHYEKRIIDDSKNLKYRNGWMTRAAYTPQ